MDKPIMFQQFLGFNSSDMCRLIDMYAYSRQNQKSLTCEMMTRLKKSHLMDD